MGKKSQTQMYIIIGVAAAIIIVVGIVMWMKQSNQKGNVVEKVIQNPPPLPPPKQSAPPPTEHETRLDDSSFDPSKPTIVMFYASWCGPSKSTLPEWQKLETALKRSPVQTLSFEDSKSKDEIMKNGVRGYPTIRLYPDGYVAGSTNFIEYSGPRDVQSMFEFVKGGGK